MFFRLAAKPAQGVKMDYLTVSWFSAGVSSAVATKLAIEQIDKILYIHIDDHHADTMRFVRECERWFGKEIEVFQSGLKTVEDACFAAGGKGYINGPAGAACTSVLKRVERLRWELVQEQPLRYVWGMDYQEKHRADRLIETMPKQQHLFPLVDRRLSKEAAHEILAASGIRRPEMYELGYHNNNCVGCVKGGMGYWNKIRQDFPEVYKRRSQMERKIGASCINGTYLDELDPEAGRHGGPIVGDCGILCQVIGL